MYVTFVAHNKTGQSSAAATVHQRAGFRSNNVLNKRNR